MNANPIRQPENGIAARLAQRALAKREAGYDSEVRRLLDAGVAVMQRCGTTSRPRVADIVSEAGLSNEAFYRHFRSKDALVEAIVEDGARRLSTRLARRMSKQPSPEGQVRCWIEGVMRQASDPDIAASTRAVLWNSGTTGGLASGSPTVDPWLSAPLVEPLASLGSCQPELDASLVAHATVGRLSDCLVRRVRPSKDEIDRVVGFCLCGVAGSPVHQMAIGGGDEGRSRR
jgi:AcrR family transcriptional regulator